MAADTLSDGDSSQVQERLRFGPAGVPRTMEGASHLEGIEAVARLGLDAMELAFVHRVNVRETAAEAIRVRAAELGVALSVHAPYYINLNSGDPAKVAASKDRIVRAAYVGALCGATHVVIHVAWRHDSEPAQLRETVAAHLREVSERVEARGADILLCPETMGKSVQFGDLDEVISLSQDIRHVAPCIDFAHLHAHDGLSNTEQEFEAVLDRIEGGLGASALAGLHMHVSGIQYGRHGEVRHLLLDDSDLDYRSLLKVLQRRQVRGRVICESPHNAEDALVLQSTWREISGR